MRRYGYPDEIGNVARQFLGKDHGHEDNDKLKSILLKLFAYDSSGSDQLYIRMNLFGMEGSEA